MRSCPNCSADLPDDASVCSECGADLRAPTTHGASEDYPPDPFASGDVDSQREWFERRYGIDIGDRSVDEFIEDLERRDFSLTVWVWLVVAAEVVSIALTAYALLGPSGWDLLPVGLAVSVLLAFAILADTSAVGQFRTWSKTRWTYVVLSMVPLCGQIAGVFYLVLRRLMRQETEDHRRRLLNAGFDVDPERIRR